MEVNIDLPAQYQNTNISGYIFRDISEKVIYFADLSELGI